MLNSYKPEGLLYPTPENREYISSAQGLERAMAEGKILEAPVALCDNEMRLYVDLCGSTGIIEREDATFSPCGEDTKDIAIITRVGKPTCFKVMGFFEENGTRIARLSRKEAQRDCYFSYVSQLESGDVVGAKITRLENFGAFADIGCGLISLLSIDCISVSRISHPSDRLAVGEVIWAAIKSIDSKSGRVFLTQRELLGTWEENANEFKVGQTVAGIIRSIESYGVFIELTPNLAGLAEIRSEDDAATLSELIGYPCAVYIKSIIPERMKIKLVLIDTYKGEVTKAPPKYFIDGSTATHIDYWKYSPDNSQKNVETIF
ncbi:MAG: S1 RNA-binding domain-containing protein [Clostridia bacterium]|nr:S1 RNA-binding domain-containing protein [Clostridia bacterium]